MKGERWGSEEEDEHRTVTRREMLSWKDSRRPRFSPLTPFSFAARPLSSGSAASSSGNCRSVSEMCGVAK